ncbi:MAG: Cof-type HAD-IIB family hydrolase [Melioribacteraceae bacterium]
MLNKEILRKIELVVFDLDGTLLDDDGNVSEETIGLVAQLSSLGVRFSIATGRLPSAVTEIAARLGIDIPLITLDGTLIQGSSGGEIIFESYLQPKYVNRALRLADQFLLKIVLCHDSAIYYTEENAHVPLFQTKAGAKLQQVPSYENYIEETLEVVIAGDYRDNMKHVAGKMAFPYTFGIRSSFYKSQDQGGSYFLEIRKMGCSKGEGMKKLLRYLKISMNNTAVIGDWYNDKSLFETEALKIAMANAVPELKKMADIVTKKNNNEGGVAEFLKMLLQSKR